MQTLFRLFLASLFLLFSPALFADDPDNRVAPGADPPEKLRVMIFNIKHCRGMDDQVNLDRTALAITEQKPDIVLLQEMDRKTERSGKVDQTEQLGKKTGMHAVFGRSIDYQGGEYGLAVLSRYPILKSSSLMLPMPVKQEQRSVLEAVVQLSEKMNVRFLCTHLCAGDHSNRIAQVEKIIEQYPENEEPILLGGDMNDVPKSRAITLLAEHWKFACGDGLTVGYPEARSKIDYILYRSGKNLQFQPVSSWVVPDIITSDHRPVVADFTLQK